MGAAISNLSTIMADITNILRTITAPDTSISTMVRRDSRLALTSRPRHRLNRGSASVLFCLGVQIIWIEMGDLRASGASQHDGDRPISAARAPIPAVKLISMRRMF